MMDQFGDVFSHSERTISNGLSHDPFSTNAFSKVQKVPYHISTDLKHLPDFIASVTRRQWSAKLRALLPLRICQFIQRVLALCGL
jgi:hypothetical protein